MIEIYVDGKGDDYPICPLRTDLNSCGAIDGSGINSCPSLNDDGVWNLPDWCPLRGGGVRVRLKDQETQ